MKNLHTVFRQAQVTFINYDSHFFLCVKPKKFICEQGDSGKKIKAEIGLARGKKKFEKREKIKKRDTEREMRRELKG